MGKKPAVLVADADPEIVSRLQAAAGSAAITPITARTAREAVQALLNLEPTARLVGSFISSNLENQGWLSVIHATHRTRTGVPIYLFKDSDVPVHEDELKGLGVSRVLGKPFGLERMVEVVNPMLLGFNAEEAMRASAAAAAAGLGKEAGDAEFVPIRADNFLSGSKSLYDVSIRLGPKKYLLILRAGDAFDLERVEGYLRKGVSHFFIRKQAQESYVKFCEHIALRVLNTQELPLEFKLGQVMNFGEQTATYLRTAGVGEQQVEHASRFVSRVRELYQQLLPGTRFDFLRKLQADVASYDHGVAVVMVASLLGEKLLVSTDYAFNVLGLAALLHDVGLQSLPEDLRNIDDSAVPASRRAQFETHPELGSRMLSTVRGVDPAVPHAIAMHHVRRNGTGYPKGAGATSLNQAAEIIGISDEFCRLIRRAKLDPKFDVMAVMEAEIFPGFSRMLVQAFRTVFIEKK
jgi:HD-GYP domain-containing protein (c-di-GMP phosphodiesterase class II)